MGTRFGLCGQFYFIIALEYTHMYLKTTNLIGFRHIYEIVFIESNKNHYAIYPTLRYRYYQKPQGEIQNETSSFYSRKD